MCRKFERSHSAVRRERATTTASVPEMPWKKQSKKIDDLDKRLDRMEKMIESLVKKAEPHDPDR